MFDEDDEGDIMKNQRDEMRKAIKSIVFVVAIIIGIIFVIVLLFGSFYIVDAGERAVLLTWGSASQVAVDSGLHFKVPIVQDVVKFEVRTQKYEADASAASADLQMVTVKMAVNYHILPESVPRLYQETGIDYASRVIQPLEQEVVKATTAKFTAEELITKREEVRTEIKTELANRLSSRGIIVEEVSIVNFDFSKSFNAAIESKVEAEQLKLKADRDLERIKVEAEQKIASAKAEAESLRLQKQEITPDLIRLRQIEVQQKAVDKWDGILPKVTGGAVPFISTDNYVASTG